MSATMVRTVTSAELAKEFSVMLLRAIGHAKLSEVRRRNSTPEYLGCCASHDFCDANMVMLDAYLRLTGGDEEDFQFTDAAVDLFNAAWDAAKAARFWPTEMSKLVVAVAVERVVRDAHDRSTWEDAP